MSSPTALALALLAAAACRAPRTTEAPQAVAALTTEARFPAGVVVRGHLDPTGGPVGDRDSIDRVALAIEASGPVQLRVEDGWVLERSGDAPWSGARRLVIETPTLKAEPGASVDVEFAPVTVSFDHVSRYAFRLRIVIAGTRRDVDTPLEIVTPLE